MWRVTLRGALDSDDATVDAWLPEAWAAVGGRSTGAVEPLTLDQLRSSLQPTQRLYVVAVSTGRPVGIVVCTDAGPSLATVDVLAIASADRNLGFGAEAIYALEGIYGTTPLLAGVPPANGLAIYFWLRAGYRPIFPRPFAGRLPVDRIWMVRGGLSEVLPG